MLFGFTIPPHLLAYGGMTVLAFVLWQFLTGMRWIKLPAKNRVRIHKITGITLVVVAAFHAIMGIFFAFGLSLPPA
jgi:hypothetical protein